jgi:uncharacterized protein YggE
VTEGSGWHEQTADLAEVDLTYGASAPTRAEAVRDLAAQVAAAEPHLAHAAVRVHHRKLWVHNDWADRRVVGCRAEQQVFLRITDVAAVEEVLSAVVGTEPAGLDGPRWLLGDRAAALREAQRRALEDARRRADGYADALGGRIGNLLTLTEAHDYGTEVLHSSGPRGGAEGAPGPDVRALGLEPEQVRVSAHCTTRWTLITQG